VRELVILSRRRGVANRNGDAVYMVEK
jgi:hypothetical protein